MIQIIKKNIYKIFNFVEITETSKIKSSVDDEFKSFTVYAYYDDRYMAVDIYEYENGMISINITDLDYFDDESSVIDYSDYDDFVDNIKKDFLRLA